MFLMIEQRFWCVTGRQSIVNSFNNEGSGLQDLSNSIITVGSCSCISTSVRLKKTHQTGLVKQKYWNLKEAIMFPNKFLT